MNREEILAKSRSENAGRSDERELQIMASASKLGMSVGALMASITALFSRAVDEPLLGLSAWALYFGMYGSRQLYHYVKTGERLRLIQAAAGIVLGLTFFAGMFAMGLSK